jgi:two-component system, NtrC family, sensor histidine kinase HydH
VETQFAELKRYVRFLPEDEAALRAFAPHARPHFARITDEFYRRVHEHEEARKVFAGPAQVLRLKATLVQWMELLLVGPWDEAYHDRRARIGQVHARIGLPQRYMFGAMDLIRIALVEVAEAAPDDALDTAAVVPALHKVLDLELAIMLESYRESYVAQVRHDDVAEKRQLARQLAVTEARYGEAERMAALGTLAAGVAHEIRNPLNAAHLQLNVARRRLGEPGDADLGKVRSAIDLAGAEVKRLAGLIEDFLAFARPHPPRLSYLDLRETAEVITALLAPEARQSGVELTLVDGPRVGAEFDGEKWKQVLLNLLRNAIDAAQPDGHVRVEVWHDGGQACLAVEDDGCGVPLDAPIFEPFFTTKDTGTGLGLSIVHRIVTDHGGVIAVDSRPGRTRFTLSFPIATTRPVDGMEHAQTSG